MPVVAVKNYQTSDGKVHTDYEVARKHEAEYHARERRAKAFNKHKEKVYNILSRSSTQDTVVSNITLDLMNKPEIAKALRDTLNGVLDYNRRIKATKK